ncbi:peptidoglycan-binding protein [Xanthomonas axonopodis pv. passiflorae]|nr:peptidoglycan-binding protein [Xanthomonas campestris pv. passiflorae]
MADEDGNIVQPVPYRLQQFHSPRLGNQRVEDFEGLVTHHPGANARAQVVDGIPVNVENPRTRSYGVIGGEIQELETRRTDSGTSSALGADQVLLTKDFMLEDSRIPLGGVNVRAVDVPSPGSGYIARVDVDRFGAVDIYDRKGGELVARILHLDPVGVSVGDSVEYGQSLGTQSNKGLPNAGKHVHMEMDTRYYQQSENYMEDLASGRLSVDAQTRIGGIEPRPIVDDGTIRIGESSDIVRQVQRILNAEGFRGADNQLLQEDGVYRLSMQPAVISYQQARGLSPTGDIDSATLQQIAPRIFPPELNRDDHDAAPTYRNIHGSAPTQDPLHRQAEEAVRRLERGLGREYDDNSARLAASSAYLAKENGLSRIDHVVLSENTKSVRQGENVFVVEGALNDPAHKMAHMKTSDAIAQPVEQSLAQLQSLGETQRQQQSQQQEQQREQSIAPQHRMV